MSDRKIAFIHYPHGSHSARLETMPFALNAVIALANNNWQVDLYLWEDKSSQYADLLPQTVRIKYLKEPHHSSLNRFRSYWIGILFQFSRNYRCVFGLGQRGLHLAAILAKYNQAPLIYFNDEFPSHWPLSRWTHLEKQAAKQAQIVVVPDPHRFLPLCREIDLDVDTASAWLPNIPTIQQFDSSIDWHDRLGLLAGKIPFLHAGSLADWAQVPEILSSIPYWDERAVAIFHSRSSGETETYRQQLQHLDSDRVFWSCEPLSSAELNSLVAYCAGSFALYRNLGVNIEYMGFSSGKLMRSIACGRPVIASNFASLSFVTEHQLGIQLDRPAEIPAAINQILDNEDFYRQRCLEFSRNFVSFEDAWDKFCDRLRAVTQIELRSN